MRMKLNNRGITVLEMAIVAVAIGVIAGLAVPRFGQVMQSLKLKTAGKDVLSSVRLSRSYAVSQKDQFGVYFDYESNQYLIFHDKANPASFSYDAGDDSVIITKTLPGNVHMGYVSFPGSVVIFKSNGSAANSGYVGIYSYNEDHFSGQMTIDVLGSTGRVKLISGGYYEGN
jgi:Tfp pilus assembly protein FimT